jgi:hypothetical protein
VSTFKVLQCKGLRVSTLKPLWRKGCSVRHQALKVLWCKGLRWVETVAVQGIAGMNAESVVVPQIVSSDPESVVAQGK